MCGVYAFLSILYNKAVRIEIIGSGKLYFRLKIPNMFFVGKGQESGVPFIIPFDRTVTTPTNNKLHA